MNNFPDNIDSVEENKGRKINNDNKNIVLFVISGVLLVAALAAVLITVSKWQNALAVGCTVGMEQFLSEEQKTHDSVYNAFYQTAFNNAEAQNHVRNRTTINVNDFYGEQKLEVLSVSTDEYVIRKAEDHPEDKINCWYKVSVSGVYTVNLDYADFIVNDELQYVCVYIPNPELTTYREPSKAEKLLVINDGKNESYRVGESIIAQIEEEGYSKAESILISNQDYFTKAKENAKENIINLVKSLNPEIPDLKVEVIFSNS